MLTDFNDSVADISGGDDFKHTTKVTETGENNNAVNHENNNNNTRPSKKSVRFDDNMSIYRLDAPCASDISSEEKQARWYDSNKFDLFKHEAATEAGVKLVRCDEGNRFSMVGDFDGKDAGSASLKKMYYNENEYSDSHTQNGGTICKRGLGYHFSRNRKKSRAVTRSAVLAWQKMLRGQSNSELKESLPALGGGIDLGRIEKTQVVLALVSAKFSRVAWEEARWRGEVDCRVAYPERHAPASAPSPTVSSTESSFGAKKKDVSARKRLGPLKKRACDDASAVSRVDVARCKRRRTGGGGCRDGADKLSPAPIECIGGMLRA